LVCLHRPQRHGILVPGAGGTVPHVGEGERGASPTAQRAQRRRGGRAMIRAAIVAFALALAVATAAEAAPSSAVIGDLVLHYDDAEWRVTPRPNGIALRPSECAAPWCSALTGVFVTIAPADGPLPSEIPRTELGFVKSLWELTND